MTQRRRVQARRRALCFRSLAPSPPVTSPRRGAMADVAQKHSSSATARRTSSSRRRRGRSPPPARRLAAPRRRIFAARSRGQTGAARAVAAARGGMTPPPARRPAAPRAPPPGELSLSPTPDSAPMTGARAGCWSASAGAAPSRQPHHCAASRARPRAAAALSARARGPVELEERVGRSAQLGGERLVGERRTRAVRWSDLWRCARRAGARPDERSRLVIMGRRPRPPLGAAGVVL